MKNTYYVALVGGQTADQEKWWFPTIFISPEAGHAVSSIAVDSWYNSSAFTNSSNFAICGRPQIGLGDETSWCKTKKTHSCLDNPQQEQTFKTKW